MIKIREVEDKDIIPLLEFLPRGFPYTTREFWLHQFNFWWASNPAYTNQLPRGWVLDKDSTIVGFIGNIPVKFMIHGKTETVAASNSWYVEPSVRGVFSFSLLHEFMKQKNSSLFLFKTGHDKRIIKIIQKYNYAEYPLPPFQTEFVYLINKKNVSGISKKIIFNQKNPELTESWELIKRFGLLFFSYLYQKPILRRGTLPSKSYTSSLCTFCDDSFSTIWEPFLKTCTVALSHDSETLNWLYFSSTGFYKRVVIQCHRSYDNILAGYMVFDIKQGKPSNARVMQLSDICIGDKDPRVLESLLSFAFEIGKQNNAALLLVWADSQETEIYFQNAFTLKRNNKHYRYARFSDAPEINTGIGILSNVCLPMIYPPQ